MLQLIFQWLMYGIGGMLELIINIFMKALDMDMNTYIELFPFLSTGYKVFRGVGIGLVAVLSVFSLLKFMVPAIFGGREPQDTVPGVLIRTAIAAGLVYGGNYILVEIVEIAKIPYDIFLNESSVSSTTDFSWDFLNRIVETLTGIDAALVVFELFVTVIVAWNLIKLMIEVCERFMMVVLLVYTSPPFFAMVAASETMDSFKRWIKMFISACVMMSVSVFFLKLILSGFSIINAGLSESGVHDFARMLLLLATCKIAQRADSYLSQIGLGTAITGGALFDDILAGGRAVSSVLGGSGGHSSESRKNTVLGAAATAMSKNGGLGGKMVDAVKAGKGAYAAGYSRVDTLKKMQEAFGKSSMVPNSVKAPGQIVKAAAGQSNIRDAVTAAGKETMNQAAGLGAAILETADPSLAQTRKVNIAKANLDAENEKTEIHAKAEADSIKAAGVNAYEQSQTAAEFAGPSMPYAWTDDLQAEYQSYTPTAREAKENFAKYGPIDPDNGSSMIIQSNGNFIPTARAVASGISVSEGDEGDMITGPAPAVAEVIAGGYNPADAIDPSAVPENDGRRRMAQSLYKDMAVNTVSNGSPEIADRLLHNPNINIGGQEGLSVGAAAFSKLYPDLADHTEVKAVRTYNLDSHRDSYGNDLYGGHCWNADVSTSDGNIRYTGIDRTAYSVLNAQERKAYTRRDLPTGRVEYIKKEPVAEFTEPEVAVSTHYERAAPDRERNSDGSSVKPAIPVINPLFHFSDSESGITRKKSGGKNK